MKKLYLLRHAKSSWDYPELDDFERPLNKRGRRDIPIMAKTITELKINPDFILSSSALRAAYTAINIAQMTGVPEELLQYHNLIYDASTSVLFNIVRNIDDKINCLLLVGHNPGLTSLANYLSDKRVENIPTCGLYGMELNISTWQKASEKSAKYLLFEYPKKYHRS